MTDNSEALFVSSKYEFSLKSITHFVMINLLFQSPLKGLEKCIEKLCLSTNILKLYNSGCRIKTCFALG